MARRSGQRGISHPTGVPFRNSMLPYDKQNANSFLPQQMDETSRNSASNIGQRKTSGTGVPGVGKLPKGRLSGGLGKITPSRRRSK